MATKEKDTKTTTKKTTVKKPVALKTKIDPKTGTLKVVEKKTTKKAEPKKTESKATSKKVATKATPKKTTTKKVDTKKVEKKTTTTKKVTEPKVTTPKKTTTTKVKEVVTPIVETKQEENVQITYDTDFYGNVVEVKTPIEKTIQVQEEPKKRGRKPSENPLPKLSSKELTIEPPKREPKLEPKKAEKNLPKEPEVIVRPTPKKVKVLNKEEKVLYKKLQEAFNYVANLTNVVEERTMDTKQIPDLTVGELHVIEMVDQNNNKPMTLIAKKLKVTVGSLTICLNRLVQKGYLLRTRHEMDHRIILVSITQKGKKVLKAHDTFHDNILGLVLEGVTLQQAMKVMTQFALVLENYYDPKSISSLTEKKGSKK